MSDKKYSQYLRIREDTRLRWERARWQLQADLGRKLTHDAFANALLDAWEMREKQEGQ